MMSTYQSLCLPVNIFFNITKIVSGIDFILYTNVQLDKTFPMRLSLVTFDCCCQTIQPNYVWWFLVYCYFSQDLNEWNHPLICKLIITSIWLWILDWHLIKGTLCFFARFFGESFRVGSRAGGRASGAFNICVKVLFSSDNFFISQPIYFILTHIVA